MRTLKERFSHLTVEEFNKLVKNKIRTYKQQIWKHIAILEWRGTINWLKIRKTDNKDIIDYRNSEIAKYQEKIKLWEDAMIEFSK